MGSKICAFGMDGLIVPLMRKFVAEGHLPHFARLLETGSVNQIQPSFPVWTPTNWATLATGAHTGTHGASRWQVQVGPDERIDSFDGRAVTAERIWTAIERAGLKGVAVHYPAAYPSGVEEGYIIDGFGHPVYNCTDYEVSGCQAYVTGGAEERMVTGHDGYGMEMQQRSIVPIPILAPAEGWSNLPPSNAAPLESVMETRSRVGGDTTRFHILVVARGGGGYDRVLICRERDGCAEIAETKQGAWSKWAVEEFCVGGERRPASLRFKLMQLAPDGSYLKLYRSQVTYTDGFTYPDELAADLLSRFGPYQEHASMVPYTSGMADFDTALEECEYQGQWFADVANYLLHREDCSLFMCHWHLYDYLNHIHLSQIDPVSPAYDPQNAEQFVDYYRRAYQVGDRILGRIWEAADGDTYVGVLSDHGACPDFRIANIRKFLVEKGFTVLKNGSQGLDHDQVLEKDMDWERTTAYLREDKGFDIFINAPTDQAFRRIEQELLLALRTWVDEDTQRTPIAVALPKRDAYLLGQWGDQCGDVVFAWDHGYVSGYFGQWESIVGGGCVGAPAVYGAHHGGFLPTEEGLSSTFGTLALAGRGVKRGYARPAERLGHIHAVDVVPTFCHILDVDPPAQSQGTVARDLFEGNEMVPPVRGEAVRNE